VKLSIVIVHYNTSDDLARCLGSLQENPPACEYRIIVVDNASDDPGLPAVRERFPGVDWLFQSRNVGYAAGVNAGLALCEADYTLILNPDIVVLPGAIDALLADADAHPRAGIIGPQLLNPDGSIQESCRRFYTFTTLVLRRTILGRLFPRARAVQLHLMRDFDHLSARPVDWVLGGCLLVRREALRRVGPMDERFFLYFEDVDWCYRMWQAGYEVRYTPVARFVHRHRRASAGGITRRGFWLHLASLISFYEKWGLLVYALKRWSGPLGTLLAWLLDMAAVNLAFGGAYLVRRLLQPLFAEPLFPWSEYHGLQLYAALLATVTFVLRGRYRRRTGRWRPGWREDLQQAGTVALLLLASTYLSHQVVYSRAVLLLFFPLLVLSLGLGGTLWERLRRRMTKGHLSLERTLLVDPPAGLTDWLAAVGDPRRLGLDLVGYLGDDRIVAGKVSLPQLGVRAEMGTVVDRYRIGQVVFFAWPAGDPDELRLLRELRRRRVRLRWQVPAASLAVAGGRGEAFGPLPSLVLDPGEGHPLAGLGRRLADLSAGVLLWPAGMLGRLVNRRSRDDRVVVLPLTGQGSQVAVHVDADGRPRSLWRQPVLLAALRRGALSLWSDMPLSAGEEPVAAGESWCLTPGRPGLTGPWAGTTRGERWRRLWTTPGGRVSINPTAPENRRAP